MKIEEITSTFGYNKFEFPIISCDNKYVENKINTFLQLTELELLIEKKEKHIFERVIIDEFSNYGKTSMAYEILSNSERNLSVRFVQSEIKYREDSWNYYYNFNPQNGDVYHLKDFFNTADFEKFKAFVSKLQTEKFPEKLKKKYGYILEIMQKSDMAEFYFDKKHIFIDSENRLDKKNKGLGINTMLQIPISEIAHLLNDFGKSALITGENLKNHRSSNDLQLYEGTIDGESPFYMIIFNLHRGIYAYKKDGKGIHLSSLQPMYDDSFNFKEERNDNKEILLLLNREDDILKGKWILIPDTEKTFHAKRM